VFITVRGKPAHVLMSIDDYRRLTGKRRTRGEAPAMPTVGDFDFDPPRPLDVLCVPEFGVRPRVMVACDTYVLHCRRPNRLGRPA